MSLSRRGMIGGLAATTLNGCDKPEVPAGGVWRPKLEWGRESRQILLNGAPLEAIELWDFARGAGGFTVEGGMLAQKPGEGLVLRADTADAKLRSPDDLAIVGAEAGFVAVSLVRLRPAGAWDGALYYATDRHGESAGYMDLAAEGPPAQGVDTVLSYDMARPHMGRQDWRRSVIRSLRWDAEAAAGGEVLIRQIVVARRPLEAPV